MKTEDSKITIPVGYEDCLSEFGPQIYDAYCGEPIGWGFEIKKRIGDERFNALGKLGELKCVNDSHTLSPSWYLITKKLTRQEAIEKYGDVTDEEYGPRGGWKSVTFGKKKFISKWLRINSN